MCSVGPPGPAVGPLNVTDVDKTSAKLTWKPPTDDGGSVLTGYLVEKKEGLKNWTRVERVNPDTTDLKVKGLTEGSQYLFRVTSENKNGPGPVLEADTATTPKSLYGMSMNLILKEFLRLHKTSYLIEVRIQTK